MFVIHNQNLSNILCLKLEMYMTAWHIYHIGYIKLICQLKTALFSTAFQQNTRCNIKFQFSKIKAVNRQVIVSM